MSIKTETVVAALDILVSMSEVIRKAGPNGVVPGHLYVRFMPILDIDGFKGAVNLLLRSGVVKQNGLRLYYMEAE